MASKLNWKKKYPVHLDVTPGDIEFYGYNPDIVTDAQMRYIALAIHKDGDVWKAWWKAVERAAQEAGVEKYPDREA